MPEIARERGFVLRVYSRREHPPPHVHVYFGDRVVRVSLVDLRVMGLESRHVPRELFDIVRKYRGRALKEWQRLNA